MTSPLLGLCPLRLAQQQPERFTPLFKYLQSPEAPPLIYVLNALCNLVLDSKSTLC